jgi:ATP-dependent phosphofructokinase / diphosphate-dependent phosphofructokinase
MGRHTGWIALESGLAGGANVILIPEIPYSMDRVLEKIREREESGRRFSIVVVAEGASANGGGPSLIEGTGRYGGIADRLAAEIEERCGKEARTMVLGHIQRGGSPVAFDRRLAMLFGVAAIRCIEEGVLGSMVALRSGSIRPVPLRDVVGQLKRVPGDSDAIHTARAMGISFGD